MQILDLEESWRVAARSKDLDGMMAIYADGAQELLPGLDPLVGTQSIRAFYKDLIRRLPHFVHQFEPNDIIDSDSHDIVVIRGTYRFTPDENNPDVFDEGKFVGVWRKFGDDWRLAINISNSSPVHGD